MKKIKTNTKKQTILLHDQQNGLLTKAIKNYRLNPCEKNVYEVINRKRFVNELGIRLWQFSLDENHIIFDS
jgi:hypothetical protein